MRLLEIDNIRDIRLATKALMGLPQHWLQDDVVEGMERVARTAPRARASTWRSTPTSTTPQSVTPLVAKAARTDARRRRARRAQPGRADARRQRRPRRRCSTCASRCRARRGILPYYFYMCDMIPNAEHWRVSVWRGAAAAARHHGLPARLRDAADRLRRAVRRQALGAPGRRVRPRARHLVLDEELPHRPSRRPTPRR